MMLKRVLTALVLLFHVILFTWLGGPVFSIAIATIAAVGMLEFCGMIGLPKRHTLTLLGIIGALAFITVAHFEGGYTSPFFAAAAGLALVWLLFRSTEKDEATKPLWTLTGILYIGWMVSHFIPLRELESGRDWVFLALFTNFATDTTAFFVGRAWGRHPLATKISAGKTWEGAATGFVAAIATSLILATILPTITIPYWQAAILGALIGVFAQIGDLAESKLKRSVGVKDSGKLLPGHGGILDRLDSILFTVVVVYYYVIWVVM